MDLDEVESKLQVLILGEASIAKTALIRGLCGTCSKPADSASRPSSVVYHEVLKDVELQTGQQSGFSGGDQLKLMLWESPAQHALFQLCVPYIKQCDVVVVVHEATGGPAEINNKELRWWLGQVNEYLDENQVGTQVVIVNACTSQSRIVQQKLDTCHWTFDFLLDFPEQSSNNFLSSLVLKYNAQTKLHIETKNYVNHFKNRNQKQVHTSIKETSTTTVSKLRASSKRNKVTDTCTPS